MTTTENNVSLDFRQIYIKDLSFESPQAPKSIVHPSTDPKIDINMNLSHERLDQEGHYEVVLNIDVEAKSEGQTLFMLEIQQAGLFLIKGFGEEETREIINVACPTALLPFARSAISDTVSKGGFPQLMISPVNFDALYASKIRSENRASDSEQAAPAPSPRPGNGEALN